MGVVCSDVLLLKKKCLSLIKLDGDDDNGDQMGEICSNLSLKCVCLWPRNEKEGRRERDTSEWKIKEGI